MDTRYLISMVTFTFTMRHHRIRLAQAPFISSRLAMCGWVRFRVQHLRSTMQNLRRAGENSDPIFSRLWTKVHEMFRRCRKLLVPSNAFFRLSVSRIVQKTYAVKSRSHRKTEQMQTFCGPQFLWEGRLRLFYSSLLGRLTSHYLAMFSWVPFADVRLRSLAIKQNAEFTEGG